MKKVHTRLLSGKTLRASNRRTVGLDEIIMGFLGAAGTLP